MAGKNQGINAVIEIWKYGSDLCWSFFCQKHRLFDSFAENVLLMEQAKFTLVHYRS